MLAYYTEFTGLFQIDVTEMYEADQYFINNVTDIWLNVVLPENHYNKIDSGTIIRYSHLDRQTHTYRKHT